MVEILVEVGSVSCPPSFFFWFFVFFVFCVIYVGIGIIFIVFVVDLFFIRAYFLDPSCFLCILSSYFFLTLF